MPRQNGNPSSSAPPDWTRACARVRLATADQPGDGMPATLDALFNPNTLRLRGGMHVGSQDPVGASHPVRMYGFSKSVSFELKLYFSQFAIWVYGYQFPEINGAVSWLTAHAFPRGQGIAAPRLYVLWPHTMAMKVSVNEWGVDYERWDYDLRVRVATVALQLETVRSSFMTFSDHGREGFGHAGAAGLADLAADPVGLVLNGGGLTGAPLRIGAGKKG